MFPENHEEKSYEELYEKLIDSIAEAVLSSAAMGSLTIGGMKGVKADPQAAVQDALIRTFYKLIKANDMHSVAVTLNVVPTGNHDEDGNEIDKCDARIEFEYDHPNAQHVMREGLNLLQKPASFTSSAN